MGRIRGVHHVAIKTCDVEGVAGFYRDVLGLEERTRHLDDRGGLRSIWLEAGTCILMIERSGSDELPRRGDFFQDPPGLHVLALSVSAHERIEMAAELEAKGVAIAHRTDYTFYVLDPEGNRVALSSYPERA
jgi:catechol 2,3-dioxygenase-like lactoylglutathione lyase family enzyme